MIFYNRFIRTHMAKTISEKEELAKLQKSYYIMKQQMSIVQQENIDMANRLKKYQSIESTSTNEPLNFIF